MRTLDDIIPPSRRKEAQSPAGTTPATPARRRSQFPYGMFGIVVCVIAVSIGALFYFSNAEVDITPNSVSTAVQSSFTANKSTGTLPFEVITGQKVASQSVAGNGSKTVTASASGTITVYNTQAQAQRLIANTRFATASGLIFRIHAPITVPGGSASKPGSVSAKVFADQAGDSYNVGPASFTIPGFAGTPQASQVYARSTTAMTGGASGTVPTVDAAIESQAREALIAALGPDLLAGIEAQIPEGYVLVPGAATTSYEALAPAASATTGMVDLKEQGTITAIVFPNTALAKAIASSVTGLGYQGESLSLTSAKNLQLTSTDAPSPETEEFSFTLTGTASFVYTIDSARIAAAIAGETRSAAEVALTNYPEIKRAVIILRPFWKKTFPEDPSSISVVVTETH